MHLAVTARGDGPTLTVVHHSQERARIVAALLGAGASPNARTPSGDTALHLACAAGDAKVVAVLLLYDALSVLDAIDTAGWTAAHHAAARGHERVLEDLLSMGCDQGVDVFGVAVGAVPLENVVSADEADRLRLLAQGGKLPSSTGTQATVVVS